MPPGAAPRPSAVTDDGPDTQSHKSDDDDGATTTGRGLGAEGVPATPAHRRRSRGIAGRFWATPRTARLLRLLVVARRADVAGLARLALVAVEDAGAVARDGREDGPPELDRTSRGPASGSWEMNPRGS